MICTTISKESNSNYWLGGILSCNVCVRPVLWRLSYETLTLMIRYSETGHSRNQTNLRSILSISWRSGQERCHKDESGEVGSLTDGTLSSFIRRLDDRQVVWLDSSYRIVPILCGDWRWFERVWYIQATSWTRSIESGKRDHDGMWRISTRAYEIQRRVIVKFYRHQMMEHLHYPKEDPIYCNVLKVREVDSRLDYVFLLVTWLQMSTYYFVFRIKDRRLQLIPLRRPRDHWSLMKRANLELLYGGVVMTPRDTNTWHFDFDAIISTLRDPDRRLSLLKE